MPSKIPMTIPSKIEIGIWSKLDLAKSPPVASEVNAVNNTIINTSSTDAPAKIYCEILLSFPYPSSIILIIPNKLGNLSLLNILPNIIPIKKMSAKLVSIKSSLYLQI